MYEGLPVESHLDQALHDHLNAEIVVGTVENKQDAVDYITWTFMYRRLLHNPNYYNLDGVSHRHLSDYLSELVESTLADLVESKCVVVEEDEITLTALNLGMISAYYDVDHFTIRLFSLSLTATTKLRGLLEILTSATDFDSVEIRKSDVTGGVLSQLYHSSPVPPQTPFKPTDPHLKTRLVLQSHFSRLQLPTELHRDLMDLIPSTVPLLYATVDILSSHGWLSPAIAAMELCQMIVQALWSDRDSPLKQIPFFDSARVTRAKDQGVESVFDLMECEDEIRDTILKDLSESQISQVAEVVNRYPSIDLEFELESDDAVDTATVPDERKLIGLSGPSSVTLNITLARDAASPSLPVPAPFYPKTKDEGWWLVVGKADSRQLLSIKRLTLLSRYACRLEFDATESGLYKLYLMCDSWIGCDQEFEFEVLMDSAQEQDGDQDVVMQSQAE